MKKLFLSIGLALILAGGAQAKTPPEVLKPYKEYRAALQAGDNAKAQKLAYEAWQQAEKLMGDTKTTGDLAQNYAESRLGSKESKVVIKNRELALKRAMELTRGYGDNADEIYLERGVNLMTFFQGQKKMSSAFKLSKELSKHAEEKGFSNSTFYGEILTLQAGYYVSRGNHKKAEAISQKALNAFETSADNYQTVLPIIANLYKGYGLEGQNKSVEAALSYQKVMEAMDGIQPNEHPLAAKALGRWSQMRSVLTVEGKLEEAEEKGLCQCWPYDKPRNESIKPIKRVPPKMPSKAWVSGFTIVEFNLDDAGKPIDEKILVSWPDGLYEKSSLASLKRWEYTPRTVEESDEDRQDIVQTISYRLTDRFGNIIY